MDNTTASASAGPFRTSTFTALVENVSTALASNGTMDKIYTLQEKTSMIFQPIGIITHIICAAGLLANIISIAAICNIPHERSIHTKLILSLASSDILIILSQFIHDYMFILTSYDCLNDLTSHFLNSTALCALLANLLAMALDHYFAIFYPFKYAQLKSNKRCVCIIISIWLTIAFIGLTDIIVAGSSGLHVCNFRKDSYQTWQPIIGIFFVTLIAIAFIYIRIYMVVRKMGLQDQWRLLGQNHDSKALRTTLLVVLTFAIGWLPHELSTIAQYIIMDHYREIREDKNAIQQILTVHKICLALIQLNSLVDPLIYSFRLQSVRDGYRILWYKIHRKNSSFINEVRFQNNQANMNRRATSSTIVSDHMLTRDHHLSLQEGEPLT